MKVSVIDQGRLSPTKTDFLHIHRSIEALRILRLLMLILEVTRARLDEVIVPAHMTVSAQVPHDTVHPTLLLLIRATHHTRTRRLSHPLLLDLTLRDRILQLQRVVLRRLLPLLLREDSVLIGSFQINHLLFDFLSPGF